MLQEERKVVLNNDDLKQIEALIGEMPTKYGLPFISLLEAASKRDINSTDLQETILDNKTE